MREERSDYRRERKDTAMNSVRKWHFFFPPIHILAFLLWLHGVSTYLIIVTEDTPVGTVVFDAGLLRLGRSRSYSLNFHKNGQFAKRLIGVHERTGDVYVKERLDCRGIRYPNLFTVHVDSVLEPNGSWKRRSTRSSDFWSLLKMLRKREMSAVPKDTRSFHKNKIGVQYYSMPLRIFVTGNNCSGRSEGEEEEEFR